MIETGMLLGERVSVGKLGSASLRQQSARKARIVKNLKTGDDLLVPAKPAAMAPKFSFSQAVKEKAANVDPTFIGLEDDEADEDE
jgi:nucleoid DNA-binding protein